MSDIIGRKLGQYQVTELIGTGGMSSVYKGYQESVDRYVAIKVLPPHPGLDDQLKERFKLEARTIGSLQNPHILPLYDYGTEGNILYLVMAYADGGTLDDLMQDGPMHPRMVEQFLRQIASALDYAHRRGVVHRDIKPNNILLDSDGNALLADFGIVKMLTESTNLTGTAIVGTPAYMSPEQGQGLEIDGRSDIYSLGVMVYEMLTSKQPYSGGTPMQVILKHINDPVPDIREVLSGAPEMLVRVLEQALAKDPSIRYQSANDFADDFRQAIQNHEDALVQGQRVQLSRKPANTDKVNATIAFNRTTPGHPLPPAQNPTNATPDPMRTPNVNQTPNSTQFGTGGDMTPPPQTIIMRESTSPLVIMGGFGLIALVIVIVAVLLTGDRNAPTTTGEAATTVAQATDDNGSQPSPTPQSEEVPPIPQLETFGGISFTSADSLGDTVRVNLEDSAAPGAGNRYVAWLVNTGTDEAVRLGEIVRDAFGVGSLTYTDPDGQMLLSMYNGVVISVESGSTETITGDVVYSGLVPDVVSTAIGEIFVASEDGLNGGSLLDGLLREATTANQHAGLAAGAGTIGGVRNHAEHTINILQGSQEDYDGDGRPQNPGRGVGVFFFLDAIEQHLANATEVVPMGGVGLQVNAEFIRICSQNVRGWAEEVVELEKEMASQDDVAATKPLAETSTRLMEQMLNGFDMNDNGTIEPFEGECGINQMEDYGILFGNTSLIGGDLRGDM